MDDTVALARLVTALEPWRAHLVIVGGWAHRLYRLRKEANSVAYKAILTNDTDLAFGEGAPLEGDIRAALVNAGFAEEMTGELRPPITRYVLGEESAGFYAEFLTPLAGSGLKRTGKMEAAARRDATVLKAGITAQKLRHLEILLIDPWIVSVSKDRGIPTEKAMDIQIPNAVTFMFQKLLIREERNAAKRAQDILYIHDTIELFGNMLPELEKLWRETVAPQLSPKAAERIAGAVSDSFSVVSDDLREAALIPQDRKLSPERMRATCELATRQILGTP